MGVTNSKIEEDKALQLCRERRKFVRQALDGRCSLAATHVAYVQSLRNIGTALRKFVEYEIPTESSMYSSTTATPEQPAVTEKSLSQFSSSSPVSPRADGTDTLSLSPSPPTSTQVEANHMKFHNHSSKIVEERLPSPVEGTVTSPLSCSQNKTTSNLENPEYSSFEGPNNPTETPPWDYFGLPNSDINSFSFQDRRGNKEQLGPDLEDVEEKDSSSGTEKSRNSENEFHEPLTKQQDDRDNPSTLTTMPLARSVNSETDFMKRYEVKSPALSPLRKQPLMANLEANSLKAPIKEDSAENKLVPKDLFSSMKDIEYLFIKASESGKEVPRMLEADNLHFRPVIQAKESGRPILLTYFRACFSCGEDHQHIQEEPAQNAIKYLTWHATASPHSLPLRDSSVLNAKDDVEELNENLFDNFCMISGSHVSTLYRLYAWERKLYDEVKASEIVRRKFDFKCKLLRQLEAKGESSSKIDKTRADIKDLYSRMKVAIHRIDSVSKRIEELRDKELQPQLEELIEGLSRMWEVMSECHKLQFDIISLADTNPTILSTVDLESRREIAIHLQNELSYLSSSFTRWIDSQRSYLQAINSWLFKCVSIQQKTSRRKRRMQKQNPPIRDLGPPIYVTCGVWLEMFDSLPTKAVSDSIKRLAAEISHFLPRQEKNQGKQTNQPNSSLGKSESIRNSAFNLSMLRDETLEDWTSGIDHFRSSLVEFLHQLNKYAETSVEKYSELTKATQEAKINYDLKSHAAVNSSHEKNSR